MTESIVAKVREVEAFSKQHGEQIKIPVEHFIHGGMYVRTVMIPAGIMITGAFIILETSLVVSGHAMVYTSQQWVEYNGYAVIPAAANRKQIFVAVKDTNLTMFFPTSAKTVKDAEEQFTNEAHLLQNRDEQCQE